jgi:hypothetical protein
MKLRLLTAGALSASLLLAACGGGSYNDGGIITSPTPPVINTPPATAGASTAGLVSFTADQTALSADTATPVVLDDFVLPADAMDATVAIATPNDA